MIKSVLVILAVLFSSISYSQSGWILVSDSIPNLVMTAIQFTSVTTGYSSGSYDYNYPGAILKTTNAGLNWQATQLNTSADDISFLDNNTGFYVGGRIGYSGIFKTTNGGNNWIKKDSMYSIFKIKFYDYNTGYVVGKYSQIRKTTNGGENWFSQIGVDCNEPSALCCIDANTWLVSNGVGKINKTTDGGVNWIVMDFSSQGIGPWSLYFINSSTGFSSEWSGGHIYKTTNTGDNWIQISVINYPNNTMSGGNLQFLNVNTGYLGGWSDSGGVFKTTNGGYNWTVQKPLPNSMFYALNFLNAATGFVGGDHGYIFKTTNGGSVFISNISSVVPDKYSLGQNYPNPFNPTTIIKFDVVRVGDVRIVVYDVMGREVQTLVNESLKPGTYETTFDGSLLNSGVYFYKLITDGFTETKKMLLIK